MEYYKINNNLIEKSEYKANLTFINKRNLDELKNLPFYNERYFSEINTFANNISIDFFKEYYFGNILINKGIIDNNTNLFFVIDDTSIYFLYDDALKIDVFVDLLNKEYSKYISQYNNPMFVIVIILSIILKEDLEYSHKLQKQIDRIENILLSDKNKSNYNKELLYIRKQLNRFKRRNDSINDFVDVLLSENDNTKDIIQYIKLIDNKSKRIERNIEHMIEHIIQLKELFQNQLDISLNHSMNTFTIIAAIFLPLQLIAGWYGMNFDMPEYKYKYAYLILTIISLLIVVALYFVLRKLNFIKKEDK
ncbi:MAG: CorA family divalent cation transporter [Erysipelotrichales bacterium]